MSACPSGGISSGWKSVSKSLAFAGNNIYLAYFFNQAGFERSGAVSIKVSVMESSYNKATSVELYRPAIGRNTNRCEPTGRRAVENTRVPIKEYVDYHWRVGSSNDLEDFHFSNPYGTNDCARTDSPQEVAASFQFPYTPKSSVVAQ